MKYYELDRNEKSLLKDFEKERFPRVPNAKQKIHSYERYARLTLNKTKNVNIRIADKDLLKIKAKAAEKGIPYQTLLSSLIHQYSDGRIREKQI